MIPQLGLAAQVADPFTAPHWWAAGVALHERLAGPAPIPSPSVQAEHRLAAWRASQGASVFARRLTATGMDESRLLALLAETPEEVTARLARPEWVDAVDSAVRRADTPAEVDADTWREAFAVPLRPFVDGAVERVLELVEPWQVDLDAVMARFAARLSRRLVAIAARTLVHEHNRGAAGLADFARRTATSDGLGALCAAYPVLARLLGQTCLQAAESTVELLRRFQSDRREILGVLLGGADPGPLTEVEAGAGDTHRSGRSVAILTFSDGRKVVYKPRDLAVHQHFGVLVDWLNDQVPGLDLRTPTALVRPGYGWMAFVPRHGLADEHAAQAFYRRQGALLALLHVVRAADVHCENLIASGDQPVLVDTESLFQAGLRVPAGTTDPAARILADSVHRTGLLPMVVAGENGAVEVSGLGGEAGQRAETATLDWAQAETGELRLVRRTGTFAGADNRPRLGTRELDAAAHEQALLDGFRLGYDAIRRDRDDFAVLLEACAGAEVRVVLRHTRGYATLLAESTRPELMRDALDRDRALDLLWAESAADPARWRVCGHEQADLWAHDVPLFTARTNETALSSSDGGHVPDALDRPGLASALGILHGMCDADRATQEWIISATLATLRATVEHRDAAPLPATPAPAPAERLLSAACAVADDILARGVHERGRVSWLGLEPVDDRRWMLLPMGAGLGGGYTGVALFFAQLAELTGIDGYATVARRSLSSVPKLYRTLATRPDLVAAVGRGGMQGLAGIAYGLARLSTLLDDDELKEWATIAVALAARAPAVPEGEAACRAAMRSVHAELALPPAAHLAAACVPTGGLSWCAGTPGPIVVRAREVDETEARQAIRRLTERPVLDDLSLCHGELGVTDALVALHAAGHDAAAELDTRAELVAGAIDRHGTPCGTPGGVATPGLLNGLAGIGYGLLRLGFAERVPSVLLFEPTPR
ncbi:type 2 lanthipeptide synthetase LanM [Actinophytocola oryzae]|uniref:type 2 lanthipeptide synthetase LanM n=1 Tax=Actinophytocola oryzae TaxID=502181 RepID=UPI001062B085|nr:type 2 lanthipeptide synthetase LanM [Actinophytocola oryzae]